MDARHLGAAFIGLVTFGSACVDAGAPPGSDSKLDSKPTSIRGPDDGTVDLSSLAVETLRGYEPLSDQVTTFRGYRAEDVLAAVFPDVPTAGLILAKCRDGYQAAIPAERFHQVEALFAFAVDGAAGEAFRVRSAASSKWVDTSPFYLVWTSTAAVSSSAFAYQVAALEHRPELPEVLARPPDDVAAGARAFAKHCVSCHALGDYGGRMGPQLLEPIPISRWVEDRYLRRWILEPQSMRRGTSMPGLPADLALDASEESTTNPRERVADDIVDFLRWLDERASP